MQQYKQALARFEPLYIKRFQVEWHIEINMGHVTSVW